MSSRLQTLLTTPAIMEAGQAAEIIMVSHGDTTRIAVGCLLGKDPAGKPNTR